VVLLGARAAGDGRFPLEATRWAVERRNHRTGTVSPVDFGAHRTLCTFVAELVAARVAASPAPIASDAVPVHAVHDVSGGGLAVALAEMACAAGSGASLDP